MLHQLGDVDATPDEAVGRRMEVEAELLNCGPQTSLEAAVAAAAISRLADLVQVLGVRHLEAEKHVAEHRGGLRGYQKRGEPELDC